MVEATGSMAEARGYNHPVLTIEKRVLAVLTIRGHLTWGGVGMVLHLAGTQRGI